MITILSNNNSCSLLRIRRKRRSSVNDIKPDIFKGVQFHPSIAALCILTLEDDLLTGKDVFYRQGLVIFPMPIIQSTSPDSGQFLGPIKCQKEAHKRQLESLISSKPLIYLNDADWTGGSRAAVTFRGLSFPRPQASCLRLAMPRPDDAPYVPSDAWVLGFFSPKNDYRPTPPPPPVFHMPAPIFAARVD